MRERFLGEFYEVEILLRERPELHADQIAEALRIRHDKVEIADPNEIAFLILDPSLKTGLVLIRVTLKPAPGTNESLESAIEQTRDWSEARSAVEQGKYCVTVSDQLCAALPPTVRLRMLDGILNALGILDHASAIHWRPSQRIVDPRAYLAKKATGSHDPFFPAVNVRLFRISNRQEGDVLMDTRGMAEFGLPDLQCHFRGLECGRVAGLLFDTARYILDEGDVIHEGNTLQGVFPDSRWACRREISMVAPEREVIDIDPGKPFTARSSANPVN